MKCKNTGCDQELLPYELEQHMKNQCPQRIVTCKDCKETMCFIKLKVCIHVRTMYICIYQDQFYDHADSSCGKIGEVIPNTKCGGFNIC